MGSSPRVCVLGVVADPGTVRMARLLDVPVLERARALVRLRPDAVFVRGPVETLAVAALGTTLAGVAAVLAVPVGPAAPLPWWSRRFHRFILGSQEDARAWGAAGIALGRLVVCAGGSDDEERSALLSVQEEALAMALRPDIRRRAR